MPITKIIKDGLVFYGISANTELYRGNTGLWQNTVALSDDYEYFAFDEKTAEIYGLVVKFVTVSDILLYAMDEYTNVKSLTETYADDTKFVKSVKESFSMTDDKHLIRFSDETTDKLVLAKLCKLNMDGYMAYEMEQELSTKPFHAETAICNPNIRLRRIENVQYSPDIKRLAIEKYNLKMHEKQRLIKKTSSVSIAMSRPIVRRKYDDDEDDEEQEEPTFKSIRQPLF